MKRISSAGTVAAVLALAVTALVGVVGIAAPAAAAPTAKDGRLADLGKRLPAVADTVGVGPRQTGFVPAYVFSQLNPQAAPVGANDFGCKPKNGQNPVVLLHGTYQNAYNDWSGLAPVLKKAGYCVFTPNYGRTDLQDRAGALALLPAVHGVADIRRSARQVGAYIDRVRVATGAPQVDLVGHSQGGLVARQWMEFEGGVNPKDPSQNEVGRVVTISTPHHGTTLLGMANLALALDSAGLPMMKIGEWSSGYAPIQQAVESPLVGRLNKQGFPQGIPLTTVATRYDEVVNPFRTAFMPGATNVALQDGCPQDTSDHLSITYSPRTISIVLRALDSERFTTLACGPHAWVADF